MEVIAIKWFFACNADDVPENGGVCVRFEQEQIASYNFSRRAEWYATQNLCPHKKADGFITGYDRQYRRYLRT